MARFIKRQLRRSVIYVPFFLVAGGIVRHLSTPNPLSPPVGAEPTGRAQIREGVPRLFLSIGSHRSAESMPDRMCPPSISAELNTWKHGALEMQEQNHPAVSFAVQVPRGPPAPATLSNTQSTTETSSVPGRTTFRQSRPRT